MEQKLTGIQFIEEYCSNPGKYLPLHPYAFAEDRSGMGWNCGILEENRPYFIDSWFDYGCSFVDVFVPETGFEQITEEELRDKVLKAGIYSLSEEGKRTKQKVSGINYRREEDDGNTYICFQILVGDEDDTFIDGCPIYGFSLLNEYNKKKGNK